MLQYSDEVIAEGNIAQETVNRNSILVFLSAVNLIGQTVFTSSERFYKYGLPLENFNIRLLCDMKIVRRARRIEIANFLVMEIEYSSWGWHVFCCFMFLFPRSLCNFLRNEYQVRIV